MRKRLIIALAVAALCAALGLSKEIVSPVVDKIYCLAQPADCQESEK